MCVARFHRLIMHSLVPSHTPHTLLLPCSWNSSRMQEPSQMLTPPSSILRHLQSQCMNLAQFCQQSLPYYQLRLQSSLKQCANMQALIWGQNLTCTEFCQASLPFCDKFSSFNLFSPLLSELVSFFWAISLTCPITRSKNTLYFPSKRSKQSSHCGHPPTVPQHLYAPYNPCTTAEGGHSNVHRITLVKRHAWVGAVGTGETEDLQ